nr:uncharacterized protein LOC116818885 isoform X2 [Chelonoidis abingdonii]XP_032626053.1 uncharacterized protein LOC116818885 isoform X2 [Chelonoidis abingdonii]XP_032626054.1 uncharacterized protein LOC116818885 isoform X2 [Chelonoidis abingdonii]
MTCASQRCSHLWGGAAGEQLHITLHRDGLCSAEMQPALEQGSWGGAAQRMGLLLTVWLLPGDVDCPIRRSLPGEEVQPNEETSLILLPLTTEKAGRDSPPQPSGGLVVTRCPERWRDQALLPVPPVAPARRGKQRLGSTASVCSHQSCKSTASHIQEVAGDDGCAHCALACLFCEFLALCSLVLDGLGCGALCLAGGCCAGGDPPGQGCGGGSCPCGGGCGLLQDCCNSADCLEICLECCSICFPS